MRFAQLARRVLCFAFVGCVPFAAPPSRLEVGAGTFVGRSARAEPELGDERGALTLRGAVHPLAATHDPATQLVDVGAGYHAEWWTPVESSAAGGDRARAEERPVHGPYVELGTYPVRARLGDGKHLRWGAYTTFDFLLGGEGRELGFGGSLGTLVEIVGTTAGAFAEVDEEDGSSMFGTALGQWGVGLFAGGAVRELGGDRYGSVTAGLSLRVPLAVGVVCCAWPDSVEIESEESLHDGDAEPAPRRLVRPSRPEKRPGRQRREYVPARPRRVQPPPSQAMPGASTPGQPST